MHFPFLTQISTLLCHRIVYAWKFWLSKPWITKVRLQETSGMWKNKSCFPPCNLLLLQGAASPLWNRIFFPLGLLWTGADAGINCPPSPGCNAMTWFQNSDSFERLGGKFLSQRQTEPCCTSAGSHWPQVRGTSYPPNTFSGFLFPSHHHEPGRSSCRTQESEEIGVSTTPALPCAAPEQNSKPYQTISGWQ